ncbi:hypothetical protein RDG69_003549 [Vibrio cholerae]|nr:hypothetical protein [Vibrio cholerae]EJR6827106.1 hypothetical protein [Vibrio cholerae]EKF9086107.1 hypothetical protein [Vibrio cholerae]EKK7230859.1 hypothetical protein [Vibrio cholerae]EKO4206262.1 hypothetical protein [Vibrio cholerae]
MNISSLFELLGQNIESDKVTSLLESNPSFEVGRPDSGRQYVISKELGVDLLFEPNEGFLAGKTKHLRNCQALFFYSEGRDGHSEFSGQLPFGFTFSSQRSELISKKNHLEHGKLGKVKFLSIFLTQAMINGRLKVIIFLLTIIKVVK